MTSGPSSKTEVLAESADSGSAVGDRGTLLRRLSGYVGRVLPGLAVALGIAAVATVIGDLVPIIGAPVTGIVIGVVVGAIAKPAARLRPGIAVASRFVLQVSVVVLGAQLSLVQVAKVGLGSLPVMVGTLVACLLAAYYLGRLLGVVGDIRTLIGVGTGICGASAIAAVTPVIGAASVEVSFAVSTIFLFNIAAVLTFPLLGHMLGMSQHAFGLFAGTAVNDTSSVVAASATYGTSAAHTAVVVKLTRTLLIIPICFGLAAVTARKDRSAGRTAPAAPRGPVRIRRLVPWFLIGFLLFAAANSAGIIPSVAHQPLRRLSVYLITMALAAIGLSTDLASFRRTGPRPLVLGAMLWLIVSATSLGLQLLVGSL